MLTTIALTAQFSMRGVFNELNVIVNVKCNNSLTEKKWLHLLELTLREAKYDTGRPNSLTQPQRNIHATTGTFAYRQKGTVRCRLVVSHTVHTACIADHDIHNACYLLQTHQVGPT